MKSGWSARFGVAAATIVLLTVAVIPWIHGGVIPLARLVLQLGACAAGLLSLISCLLRQQPGDFPKIVFPLGILAALGLFQLMPVHAPLISQMDHAVNAELRSAFMPPDARSLGVRTGSPGDTRLIAAQLVALMLLAVVGFDQLRTRRAVIVCLLVHTANAVLFSMAAMVQMFRRELFLIRSEWWTGWGQPFGTFVNPNSAAGWLTMGMASAVGLLVLLDQQGPQTARHSGENLRNQVVRWIGNLTGAQIAAWCALAVIGAAIAAANSRAGMIATLLGSAGVILIRFRRRQLVTALVIGILGFGLVVGLTSLLNLDQRAAAQLETLAEPVKQLRERLLHWRDAIQVVRDFPVFGAGLGAYRYVTLPYLTWDSGTWFQNADNQFLETLVEAGLVGGVAFLFIGLPALLISIRILRHSAVGAAGPTEVAVAMVLLFAVISQGFSALFDFGAVGPAASALFVAIVAVLMSLRVCHEPEIKNTISRRFGMVALRSVLIACSAVFVPDLSAAHNCYVETIAGQRLLRLLEPGDVVDERAVGARRLRTALANRADDATARETLLLLEEDNLRARLLENLTHHDHVDNYEAIWPASSPRGLARAVWHLADFPMERRSFQTEIRHQINRYGLSIPTSTLLGDLPVNGVVASTVALWSFFSSDSEDSFPLSAVHARFLQPANSRLLYDLGDLANYKGHTERSLELWQSCLRVDDSFRAAIMLTHSQVNGLEESLKHFAPENYEQAAAAYLATRELSIQTVLSEFADQMWSDLPPSDPPSHDVQRLRAHHLRRQGRIDDQVAWLERCVRWSPRSAYLRSQLAAGYTKQQRFRDSLWEWREVQRISPGDRRAARSIAWLRARIRENANK